MISIIIPYHNASQFIHATLASVYQQKNVDIEVIVVDDGSDDEHVEVLRKCRARYEFKLITQANKGVSTARNKGAVEAKGNHFLFLDADDTLTPKAAYSLLSMVKEEEVVMGNYLASSQAKETKPNIADEQFVQGNPIQLGTALIPRQVFKRVGGFNENLAYAEDMDFWFRLWMLKIPLTHIDELILNYRIHESSVMRQIHPRKFIDNQTALRYRISQARKRKLLAKERIKVVLKRRLKTHHWYARELGFRYICKSYFISFMMGMGVLIVNWLLDDWRYIFGMSK